MNERFDFDQLARDVAGGLSRREALRRLGGGLAAGLLASLGVGRRAFAAPTNSPCQNFCRNTCGIRNGGSAFNQCVSSCARCLSNSGSVCACPAPGSAAVVCCPTGKLCCGGSCCPAGQYCCNNQCSVCPCNQTLCTGSQGTNCCTAGQTCCDGACVNAQSDPNNCGTCGHGCASGESCVSGQCTCGSSGDCLNGKLCCGGMCLDVSSDPANCGACGHACTTGQVCQSGICVTCATGAACAGRCCPQNAHCSFDPNIGAQACFCDPGYFGCGGANPVLGDNPAVCCSVAAETCQNGSCGACPAGQTPCFDKCCPPNSTCSGDGIGDESVCLCNTGYSLCGQVCCSGSEYCVCDTLASGGSTCQTGHCVACPTGQDACVDHCCPAHATCAADPSGGQTCQCGGNGAYSPCGTTSTGEPAACCSAGETCNSVTGVCIAMVGTGP